MKNDIQNIFGSTMARSMEGMANVFKNANMTPEEIAESIKDFHETTRAGIHISALSSGDKETADKIDKANQIIKGRRISEFKKVVANGTEKEFLSTMPWTDKSSLKVDMGLFRIGIPSEKPLTEEEQRYSDIIEKSIDEDIKKEALSQGFSSVEEWREHNAKVASSMSSSFGGIRRR